MNRSYTDREVDEMQQRRDAYAREGVIIGLMLAALSGATVGFLFGWLSRGWLN